MLVGAGKEVLDVRLVVRARHQVPAHGTRLAGCELPEPATVIVGREMTAIREDV